MFSAYFRSPPGCAFMLWNSATAVAAAPSLVLIGVPSGFLPAFSAAAWVSEPNRRAYLSESLMGGIGVFGAFGFGGPPAGGPPGLPRPGNISRRLSRYAAASAGVPVIALASYPFCS